MELWELKALIYEWILTYVIISLNLKVILINAYYFGIILVI